jgi:microcystin-dependent protein
MGNYAKLTDFAAKDSLASGSPQKIVKGTELDDEFVAIAAAISSKSDAGNATLTGNVTAPTPSTGDNSTKVATTAFVATALAGAVNTGEVKMWPTASAPTGYVLCNGAAISRTLYATLFALIGTAFGVGDGSTTFNVPNFNDRMPIGAGSLYAAAVTGGSKDAVVVSHTHTATVTDPGHVHNVQYYYGGIANPGNPSSGESVASMTKNTASATTGISVAVASEGESGTNKNLPPYLGIYFIIKT